MLEYFIKSLALDSDKSDFKVLRVRSRVCTAISVFNGTFLFRTISISNSFQVRTLVNQYQRLLSPRRLVINDIYPNNRLLCRGGYTNLILGKQLVTLSQL